MHGCQLGTLFRPVSGVNSPGVVNTGDNTGRDFQGQSRAPAILFKVSGGYGVLLLRPRTCLARPPLHMLLLLLLHLCSYCLNTIVVLLMPRLSFTIAQRTYCTGEAAPMLSHPHSPPLPV